MRILLTLLLALLAGGCSPLRVSFDIGFAPTERIVERETLADAGAPRRAKVALISVDGFIADANQPGFLGEGPNPVDQLVTRLQFAMEDPDVRAVVLRINSPGGTVTGSDIMHREARRFAAESGKPVVASLGEVAASGGYYVALAADHIVAEPSGVTGSIGVIVQTVNVSEGLERLGVRARAVTSGPNKDIANPLEPAEERHFKIIQDIVEEHYRQFRGLVLERRSDLDPSWIDRATDGRVMTGAQAAEIGLVDSTGSVRDAFAEAKRLAGIERARLVAYVSPDASPATPYAVRPPAPPTGAHQVNLLQVNLNRLPITGRAGFYYLWSPTGGMGVLPTGGTGVSPTGGTGVSPVRP